MLSPEFELTFDRASAIIEAGHREPEVSQILADFRSRASSDTHNPLKNRALIVDPRVDSQMLNVSESVFDVVVKELRQFHLLNVWARATCPNTGDTIVETRNTEKFRRLLDEPCPHCGQDHSDLQHENIELFFAINFETSSKPLSLRELLAKPPPKPLDESRSRKIWRRFTAFFQKRDGSPVEKTAAALAENRPAAIAPTVDSVLWKFSLLAGVWLVLTLLPIALLVVKYDRPELAAAIFVASLAFFTPVAYLTWRRLINRYPIQRQMLFCSQWLGGGLFTGGMTGLRLKAVWDESKPLRGIVEFGEPDEMVIRYGFFVFALGVLVTGGIHIAELLTADNNSTEPR